MGDGYCVEKKARGNFFFNSVFKSFFFFKVVVFGKTNEKYFQLKNSLKHTNFSIYYGSRMFLHEF